MIRCLIVDDEPLASKLLASYIEKIDDVEVRGIFNNPLHVLSYLEKDSVDLILLDIQMPELRGTQLAKLLDPSIQIIFTSAYQEYAVEGFELRAIDYLVKPINFVRFLDSINRAREYKKQLNLKTEILTDTIFVKTEYRLQKVLVDNIQYLQGMGDYCSIICDDQKILTLEKLKSFESRLPKNHFIRVHKSYIVAIKKIDYIEKKRIKIMNHHIPIGGTYEDTVYNVIGR